MAELKWTDAQSRAIAEKGRDILVSAAAGSGKTAVLVERVIRKITDRDDPVDIDSLLIMTFTRAAAAQMKDKISEAIKAAIMEDPSNERLKKQLCKVPLARIYTIDSLCMEIVKENFEEVDIDPGFRVADEAEMKMLMSDVLGSLIEDHYAAPSDEFINFVNFYIDKSDSRLDDIILNMYRFSQSHPEPYEWISNASSPYREAAGYSADGENRWIEYFARYINIRLEGIRKKAETGLKISRMNYGPYKYEPLFEKIISFTDEICSEDAAFDFRRDSLTEFTEKWEALPRFSKNDEVDGELKTAAQNIRKSIKAAMQDLLKTFFARSLDDIYDDMAGCAGVAGMISSLTMEFSRRLNEAKKERRIEDFSGVAHYALKILIKRDEEDNLIRKNGVYEFSSIADRMAEGISEIIVDEYQDTNLLQDCLIEALSSRRFDRPNVFMVGDVKQSIYGFRLACPELFTEKYNDYASGGDDKCRILLNSNFRSRREIVDFANLVFERAMSAETGGIDYRDGNRLEAGAEYPGIAADENYDNIPELIFINGRSDDAKKAESYEIASKIIDLMKNARITDKDTGMIRNVRYGDIAILTRTSDNVILEQTLDMMEIPVLKSSGKGFFDSLEVRLVLDLLRLIDNPYQDIPLAAVLTSPLVGLGPNDLAVIKSFRPKDPEHENAKRGAYNAFSLYEACRVYTAHNEHETLRSFFEKLADYRQRAVYMGVSELLDYVTCDIDLDEIFMAMPQGEGRLANIAFLKSRAESFAEGSYTGLFNFIRYIGQMQDVQIDFGQARSGLESADAVRMMTIHKSKGLEFPIVFIANAGKNYNETDLKANIIMDEKLGIGLEMRDTGERTIRRTALMETIRTHRKIELYAEEMRLLYVAVTRAQEKLIITGSDRFLSSAAAGWEELKAAQQSELDQETFLKESSYLKLLGSSLAGSEDSSLYRLKTVDITNVEEERAAGIADLIEAGKNAQELVRSCALQLSDEAAEKIAESLSFDYEHRAACGMPVKLTASQLERTKEGEEKYHAQSPSEHRGLSGDQPDEVFAQTPEKDGVLTGAERGNAYHAFFELLDYDMIDPERSMDELCADVRAMISAFEAGGRLCSAYAKTVEPEKIAVFLSGSLGRRMKRASDAGLLRREQQFVMQWDDGSGEMRLLQGIIDAFFEENGGIILVDYKTDRGKTPEDFRFVYSPQQDAYARAISAALSKPVTEKILYSVENGSEILLD